jgi:hypothetical protein
MNVKIMMDQAPSSRNKKLMSFLMNNVKVYRSNLRMSIITIPKDQHELLDAKITALPAAYIGTNIVIGYKQIMSSITTAFNQTKAKIDVDPVQSFWDNSIKDGLGEVKRNQTDGDNLSTRFTEVTKKRSLAYAKRAPKFKNAPNQMPAQNTKGQEQPINMSNQRSNAAPTSTAEMIMQNTEGNTPSVGDADDPALLESDPYMKMFWANQTQTPGT